MDQMLTSHLSKALFYASKYFCDFPSQFRKTIQNMLSPYDREINIESPIRSFERKEHFALLSANNTIFSSEGLILKCVYHVIKYIDLKQLLM